MVMGMAGIGGIGIMGTATTAATMAVIGPITGAMAAITATFIPLTDTAHPMAAHTSHLDSATEDAGEALISDHAFGR